jgi:hypothetical protein
MLSAALSSGVGCGEVIAIAYNSVLEYSLNRFFRPENEKR